MVALSASHSRAADSTSVCSTVCRSKAERLITFSTSAVAVCCRNDSDRSSVRWRSSLSSRALSMAMTAWAAKLASRVTCLSVKGTNFLPKDADNSNGLIVLQHRHSDHGPNAAEFDRRYGRRIALSVSWCCCEVGNMSRLLRSNSLTKSTTRSRTDRAAFSRIGKRGRHVVACDGPQCAVFMKIEEPESSLTKLNGVCQHGLEDRRQITKGTRNDAQNLSGSSLLLQRLAQLVQ